jgi:hypothetical protein
MTTSGTSLFNLDIQEIIEEAFERAGLEMRTGYDLRSARRSLNILAAEWANRGYNLWTVTDYAILMSTGVATYNLPADTIDTLDHVVRSTQNSVDTDIVVRRLSLSSYAAIPNKMTPGRPVQVFVDRQIQPTITVWPVPTNSDLTLVVWYLRRMQDTGAGGAFQRSSQDSHTWSRSSGRKKCQSHALSGCWLSTLLNGIWRLPKTAIEHHYGSCRE